MDHFTSYCWLFPLNAKSQVASIFVQFRALVERQFNHQIKNVYINNGGEFVALRSYFNQNGISWLTMAPYTPEQNVTSERRHRHILETTRALLHHAKLPPTFWSYAAQTSIYLIAGSLHLSCKIGVSSSSYSIAHPMTPNFWSLGVFAIRGSNHIILANLKIHLSHAYLWDTLLLKVLTSVLISSPIACLFHAMFNFLKTYFHICRIQPNQIPNLLAPHLSSSHKIWALPY